MSYFDCWVEEDTEAREWSVYTLTQWGTHRRATFDSEPEGREWAQKYHDWLQERYNEQRSNSDPHRV